MALRATRTHYEVVGLSPAARQDEIEAACLRLAQQNHPSKLPGDAAAAELFAELERAYEILVDPGKRAAYDSVLVGGRPAGWWRRAFAYSLDMVPIWLVVLGLFYFLFGLGEAWSAYRADPTNINLRLEFLVKRNWARDTAFVIWIVYCVLMEASPLQGTFGKAALGLQVVGPDGGRISLARSIKRNLAKLLSYIPAGLGFLWAAFSKEKRTWHDSLSKTSVRHGALRRTTTTEN